MSRDLLVKNWDSDYWENGDYVTTLVSVDGQLTAGKDYQIKWIDWEDVVYVDDDSGIENGWHVSRWKFVKEE